MSTNRRRGHIASIGKAFTALSTIADRSGPVSPSELATIMGTPLPTTYHLVQTLVAEGALVKVNKLGYVLGPRIGALADAYAAQGEPLDRLEGPLRDLAEKTGETTYLSAWRKGDIEVVCTVAGRLPVLVAQVPLGTRGDAHARASGKVLLAHAPTDIRDGYLTSHGRQKLTPNTMTDRMALEEELNRVRERGYALDLEEFALDVSCVAAPVMSAGHVLGAYTVSCPSSRFARHSESMIESLLGACRTAGLAVAEGF